jgi:hypothetical protein
MQTVMIVADQERAAAVGAAGPVQDRPALEVPARSAPASAHR